MLTTLIAVLGTLLAAAIAGHYQQRAADRSAHEARHQQLAEDRRAAVVELTAAISTHRATMYHRADARLRDLPDDRVQELRDDSHKTRAAVTKPLITLRLLIGDPAVRAAADHMVTTTYAMRSSMDRPAITAARQAAVAAHDQFVDLARTRLAIDQL